MTNADVRECDPIDLAGLFGVIVVTRKGMTREDGRPKDVDREFVSMYIAINENESWARSSSNKLRHLLSNTVRSGRGPSRIVSVNHSPRRP